MKLRLPFVNSNSNLFTNALRKSLIAFTLLIAVHSNSQTVVTNETFPNQFNVNFGSSNSSNGTFAGSTGTWTSSVNSNSLCAIAVIPAYYSAVTNAIKIVNWNTAGKGAADCHAASPTVNLSGYACAPSLDLTFKLYTYTTSTSDPNSFFKVEFSNDNGANWTSFHSWSSQYIANNYPQNGLTTVSVAIPAAYRVSGFKYRFSGYKPANQANNFYLFVDDAKITATSCSGGTGSIGDRVWFDADGDGIQDASETGGLTGITVQLKNSGGTVIATTTTNASGNYLFSGLAAGTYKVVFPVSISGAIVTGQDVGGNDDIDSDASQTTGETGNIVLATGQNITNVDAGYCPITLSLGNRVWYDANNNGINDSENGIRNVSVFLYKDDNNDNIADGPSIANTTTDLDGFYMFNNLGPGNYIVGAIIPPGYMSSSVNGGDPDNDINLDDNGQVFVGNEVRGLGITLIAGTEPTGGGDENITYDFGMLPDCACTNSAGNLLTNASFENGTTGWSWNGGTLTTGTGYIACGTKNGFNNWSSGTSRVWQDVNVGAGSSVTFSAFAGTHAPGIACSPKLSLIFLNSSNAVISQIDVTVTRVVGDYHNQLEYYSINNAVAPAGTVKVRVQSSITCNTMKLDAFCLTAIVPQGSIGDRVWKDDNRNGIQDAGEVGIAGVTMELLNASNTVIATTTTNASGIYNFSNLPAGNYSVRVTPPANYNVSPKTQGSDLALDSDIDPVTLVTGTVTLAAGQNRTDIDAGLFLLINLSGNVFHDANAMNDNLVNSTSATSIPVGLRVYLVNSTTGLVERSTIVSSATGTFNFNNINPLTTYRVYLSSVSFPIGYPESAFPLVSILPGGWEHTGQKNANPPNSPTGSDSINDGRLTVPVGVNNVINVNFGIRTSGGDVVQG